MTQSRLSIGPRLQRCTQAAEDGDYQFAGERLSELDAEGHIDTEIGVLRAQLNKAVRQKTIAQLMRAHTLAMRSKRILSRCRRSWKYCSSIPRMHCLITEEQNRDAR